MDAIPAAATIAPDSAAPAMWLLWALLAGAGAVLVAKLLGLVFLRGRTVHRLGDAMNVSLAVVSEWSGREGYVRAGGELWRARSPDTLVAGDEVSVVAMDGLVLKVTKKTS